MLYSVQYIVQCSVHYIIQYSANYSVGSYNRGKKGAFLRALISLASYQVPQL